MGSSDMCDFSGCCIVGGTCICSEVPESTSSTGGNKHFIARRPCGRRRVCVICREQNSLHLRALYKVNSNNASVRVSSSLTWHVSWPHVVRAMQVAVCSAFEVLVVSVCQFFFLYFFCEEIATLQSNRTSNALVCLWH